MIGMWVSQNTEAHIPRYHCQRFREQIFQVIFCGRQWAQAWIRFLDMQLTHLQNLFLVQIIIGLFDKRCKHGCFLYLRNAFRLISMYKGYWLGQRDPYHPWIRVGNITVAIVIMVASRFYQFFSQSNLICNAPIRIWPWTTQLNAE